VIIEGSDDVNVSCEGAALMRPLAVDFPVSSAGPSERLFDPQRRSTRHDSRSGSGLGRPAGPAERKYPIPEKPPRLAKSDRDLGGVCRHNSS